MESHFPIPAGHQSALARQRVMDDLNNLVKDAELLLRATAGDVTEKASEARRQLSAGIERVKATAEDFRIRGVEAAKSADAAVRDHPYQSIFIALGVGAVVGLLLGNRGSARD